MLKTLIGLECKKFLDLNVLLHSKNQKNLRRHSAMNLIAYGIVTVVMSGMLTLQILGLMALGAGPGIPAMLILAGSGLTLLICVHGMGQSLFSPEGLSVLRAMPVKSSTIALARILGRYPGALLPNLVVLLPGTVLYGVLSGQHGAYYLIMGLGLLAVPLLPLAVSALLGTGIMAVSAGSRRPKTVQAWLSVLLMLLLLTVSLMGNPTRELPQDPEALGLLLAEQLPEMIPYPPARWLEHAAVTGRIPGLLGFLALSAGGFSGVAAVLCGNFDRICRRLARSRGGRTWKLKALYAGSPLGALYRRERRRYFASSIYVSNTVIGPILALAGAAALMFVDLTPAEKVLPVPVSLAAPVAWSLVCCLMPACSVAVTMEGKQIWQIKTLPVSVKTWLDSKLLWSLTLMGPSYVLSQIAMTVAFRPALPELFWQMAMPLALMGCSCTLALAADLRFHSFDYVREEAAVKQSLSALAGGLGGGAVCLVCGAMLLLLGDAMWVRALLLAAVSALAAIFYGENCRKTMENL